MLSLEGVLSGWSKAKGSGRSGAETWPRVAHDVLSLDGALDVRDTAETPSLAGRVDGVGDR